MALPLKSEQTRAAAAATLVASVAVAFLIVISAAFALRVLEARINAGRSIFLQKQLLKSKSDATSFWEAGTARQRPRLGNGYRRLAQAVRAYILIPTASAREAAPVSKKRYEAKFFIESDKEITMRSGEVATYTVGFKNIGSKEWRNDGKNYISVYAAKPYYRKSRFFSEHWEKDIKPARLRDAVVAPGAVGYFEITLKAPEKPGNYIERFNLAVENSAWMPGGYFYVPVKVEEKPAYSAALLLKSSNGLALRQGEEKKVTVGWKNNGRAAWKERAVVVKSLEIGNDDAASPVIFAASGWGPEGQAVKVGGEPVAPGRVDFIDFNLRAPSRTGEFSIKFALVVDGEEIEGGDVDFTGNVTDESRSLGLPAIEPLGFTTEPNIRIGLCFIPYDVSDKGQTGIDPCVADKNQILRVSSSALLSLQNEAGTVVAQNIGANVSINFDPVSRFTVAANGVSYSFMNAVKVVPNDLNAVLVFENWKNIIRSGENDNRQRGILEFRYLDDRKRLWAINELPLERYVKGIAEIPAGWPLEVQKAQAIAARTYAAYYLLAGGKHASQQHILNAGEGDQVYHGVGAELRRPLLSAAVDETAGILVTYGGGVVSTPYFGQSDGRTKSWAEVYGSTNRPWLQSVEAPYDLGKTLRGHGIGMSQMDAYGMAKSGATYEQILKHYYTGIELKRAY
ncbi:SpoIID/LytB domain-containing protein [Candidatus Uhrbacteria bacterium]|nr:SpoIID/LytB domain-containing protein [Candidatus Uhrbacteria bacterium]